MSNLEDMKIYGWIVGCFVAAGTFFGSLSIPLFKCAKKSDIFDEHGQSIYLHVKIFNDWSERWVSSFTKSIDEKTKDVRQIIEDDQKKANSTLKEIFDFVQDMDKKREEARVETTQLVERFEAATQKLNRVEEALKITPSTIYDIVKRVAEDIRKETINEMRIVPKENKGISNNNS